MLKKQRNPRGGGRMCLVAETLVYSRSLPASSGAGHWVGIGVQLHMEGDRLVDVGVARCGAHRGHGRGFLGASGPTHCWPEGAALPPLPQE